ncbi:MAG: DUF481 domain-containing protein [Acidobacteriota bacterium]
MVTGGNARANTLGLNNSLAGRWGRSSFTLRTEAVRAASATDGRFAVGTTSDFAVVQPRSEVTAERYFIRAEYSRTVAGRLSWSCAGSWERNRPSGIEARLIASGGLGNTWYDREDLRLISRYALTYTDETQVARSGDGSDSFAGIRASLDLERAFGRRSRYELALVLDGNLDETADYRADLVNSVSVAMTDRLSLKVGLKLLYDNRPAFEDLDLRDAAGNPLTDPAGNPIVVSAGLDELDTIFTTSLGIDF